MNITLITRDGCSFCVKAKNLLETSGLDYDEMKIERDIERDEVLKTYPEAKLLPLFLLDSEHKGSYDELYDWVNGLLNKEETQSSGCPVN